MKHKDKSEKKESKKIDKLGKAIGKLVKSDKKVHAGMDKAKGMKKCK